MNNKNYVKRPLISFLKFLFKSYFLVLFCHTRFHVKRYIVTYCICDIFKEKKRSFHREWPVGLPGKQLNFKPLEDIISSKIFNKASSFFVVIAVYLDNGAGMVLQQG